MLGVSWNEFRTNISIIRELDIKQRLSTLAHSRILKFFGHVSRRDNNSIERLVVQGKVEGTKTLAIDHPCDGPIRSNLQWEVPCMSVPDYLQIGRSGECHNCHKQCPTVMNTTKSTVAECYDKEEENQWSMGKSD
ncbi:jg26875 [Pararge aegeria aegeria]|uniref:Jg26875 protein n=1 Tax=Pararge aegeria aegeria TaxID=348720 RepID=A0A8S4SAE5_9NEOP|nr:jg26875 [Pararge aegeria aegeria]